MQLNLIWDGISVTTTFAEALFPLAKRMQGPVRDIEILRVATLLDGDDFAASAKAARDAVLKWASSRKRAGGTFPKEALEHADFELLAGGRNSTAVRFLTETADLWALRAEVPDENVAGRVWTNEICPSANDLRQIGVAKIGVSGSSGG